MSLLYNGMICNWHKIYWYVNDVWLKGNGWRSSYMATYSWQLLFLAIIIKGLILQANAKMHCEELHWEQLASVRLNDLYLVPRYVVWYMTTLVLHMHVKYNTIQHTVVCGWRISDGLYCVLPRHPLLSSFPLSSSLSSPALCHYFEYAV